MLAFLKYVCLTGRKVKPCAHRPLSLVNSFLLSRVESWASDLTSHLESYSCCSKKHLQQDFNRVQQKIIPKRMENKKSNAEMYVAQFSYHQTKTLCAKQPMVPRKQLTPNLRLRLKSANEVQLGSTL